NVNAFSQQFVSQGLRQLGIIQHDGYYGSIAIYNIKPCLFNSFFEIVRILFEGVSQAVILPDQVQHLDGSTHDGRCQRVGEQVWAGTLPQHFNDLLSSGGIAAHGASQGFAESPGDDVYPSQHPFQLQGPDPFFPDEPGSMSLIDHYQRVIFVGQVTDLVQRRHQPVHREHAVGNYDLETRPVLISLLQLFLQIL